MTHAAALPYAGPVRPAVVLSKGWAAAIVLLLEAAVVLVAYFLAGP